MCDEKLWFSQLLHFLLQHLTLSATGGNKKKGEGMQNILCLNEWFAFMYVHKSCMHIVHCNAQAIAEQESRQITHTLNGCFLLNKNLAKFQKTRNQKSELKFYYQLALNAKANTLLTQDAKIQSN